MMNQLERKQKKQKQQQQKMFQQRDAGPAMYGN